jgi:hypothetical protein
MKARLMSRDMDFTSTHDPKFSDDYLADDLELQRIIEVMAQDDNRIRISCREALFCPLQSIQDIRYRQEILRDVFLNPDTVRQLYDITLEAEKRKRGLWHWLSPSTYLSSNFSTAVTLLKLYVEILMQLRSIADKRFFDFQSEGFRNLFIMFQRELDDDYFSEVRTQLDSLNDRDGMLVSAVMGSYLQGVRYTLRRKTSKDTWLKWVFSPSYTIAPRDDSGATDLSKRRDRAINEATNALAQAAEHLEGFFAMLKGELAFYVGNLNLVDRLREIGVPICIPDLLPLESKDRWWEGLYDVSLALLKTDGVIGNDLDAKDKSLYVITGANQGGKSTFLRSVGQAQLMMQCGMFVGATNFCAPIRSGVYSHFKKEEDTAMKSGKLDEELSRMSKIAEHMGEGSLMLFNESFAATNEREGSEICRQITQALIENGVEVFSVTHLHTYACAFLNEKSTDFLCAERLNDGTRTYKIVPGKPLQTAFGEDLYNQIFGKRQGCRIPEESRIVQR